MKKPDENANILTYLQWRGDLTFSQSSFCQIDSLILCCLSYLNWDGIAAGRALSESVSLQDAIAQWNAKPEEQQITRSPLDRTLLELLSESARFRDVRLFRYEAVFSERRQQQFSAVSFLLGKSTVYAAFRGTDNTLTGWREDFNMSFLSETPSQQAASAYLRSLLETDLQHVLVDLGLPDIDGIEVIRSVRTWSNLPIIVLSARSEDSDKIEALDNGADDYLTKPFSVDELLARLRVTQRRLNLLASDGINSPVFVNGPLKIDFSAGCVWLSENELHLTPIEYKLLCVLAHNVGKVLTHTSLTQKVWGSTQENDIASLRVYMASLRKKLERCPDAPHLIQTHVGVGYRMLRVENDEA